MKKIILLAFFSCFILTTNAQNDDDAFYIKDIYSKTLTESQAYDWLYNLTTNIGGRISGSPEAMAAVEYTRQMLDTLGLDKVYLQECYVPHWERGDAEQARIVNSKTMGTVDLTALALGNSIGTGNNGLTAEVIEVQIIADDSGLTSAFNNIAAEVKVAYELFVFRERLSIKLSQEVIKFLFILIHYFFYFTLFPVFS